MLKVFQTSLQQHMNWELPDVEAGSRKGRWKKDQTDNICWIIEKARELKKKSTSASLTMLNPLTVWITTHCGKFLKRQKYQTTLPVSLETCMQDKNQQLEPNMEQRTGSKFGKENVKAIYHHPAYLTYMQTTSWEMQGWMNHKLESRFPGEISIASDMLMIPL